MKEAWSLDVREGERKEWREGVVEREFKTGRWIWGASPKDLFVLVQC